MFPPGPVGYLDIEALSGICGSISIACWVVVFSPQIIENFRRKSADALSLLFLIIWLVGDVFNILGAMMQGVLPTMIILAVYYTLADIVLLFQCFYYRGFTWSDGPQKHHQGAVEHFEAVTSGSSENLQSQQQQSHGRPDSSEQTPLLSRGPHDDYRHRHQPTVSRRRSSLASVSTLRDHIAHLDSSHLSPAMPFIDHPKPSLKDRLTPASTLQIVAFNTFTVALVCAAGVLGWYISVSSAPKRHRPAEPDTLEFDIAGQIFGYLCAVLYLGSRIPQLLLNWRRQSTEGVSLLFFLFACIGNLTYVFSIFAYSPVCWGRGGACRPGEKREIYGRYILVNASWLAGSLGTLFLDLAIFAQFVVYRQNDCDDEDEEDARNGDQDGESEGTVVYPSSD